jgi:hypothetical protein
MRSQSPTTMSGSCHVTESLETLSASEHDRRAMTSERIQQRIERLLDQAEAAADQRPTWRRSFRRPRLLAAVG